MTRIVLFSKILRFARAHPRLLRMTVRRRPRRAQGDKGKEICRLVRADALLGQNDRETLQNKFLTVALKQERKASPRACLLFGSVAALSVPSQSSTWLLRLFRASQVHGCFVCSEPVKYMAALSVPSRSGTWLVRLFMPLKHADLTAAAPNKRAALLCFRTVGGAALR